jgi:hypothetical protein
MTTPTKTVGDLERNDVAGALEVLAAYEARGSVPAGLVESLLMLQDDPTELLEQLPEDDGEEPAG